MSDKEAAAKEFARATYNLATGGTVSVFGEETVAEELTVGQESSKYSVLLTDFMHSLLNVLTILFTMLIFLVLLVFIYYRCPWVVICKFKLILYNVHYMCNNIFQ